MKKNKKSWSRLYTTFAALSVTAGTVCGPVSVLANTAAEKQDQEPAEVSVYPRPQSMEYDGTEGMKLQGTVDIVVHGTQNEVTLNRLKTILDDRGVSYQVADEVSPDHATILLSDDADHCDECDSTLEGTTKEQGYALVSDNDANSKGTIVITGHDQDGVYNGVLTLGQLLEQTTEDGRFAEVSISDYPDMLLRGAIEGFYGIPWTFANRKKIIQDTAKFKMNTYIYAPKDDPYHKDRWRDLYPEDQAQQIHELVEEAQKNNLHFIWCVHPGNGFNYSGDEDYNKLIAKLEQLYSLGVRQFGISYDDLGGNNEGTEQATIINRVNAYMKEKHPDVRNMLTVAKRYTDGWGSSWQTYLKPFLDTLDDDVTLMWTGLNTGGVCGANSFNGPKNNVGYDKPLAFWFNYPVNDMGYGRLLMGELDASLVDPNVTGLAGFYMNPMNQAQASKVALYQGADYSWNTPGFQSHESWLRAIKEVAGEEHAAAFARFADNTSGHTFEDIKVGESKELQPKLTALDTAIASGKGIREAVMDLKAEFKQMEDDAVELKGMDDELLLGDISVHLDGYEKLGQAGQAAMDGFLAALDLNAEGMTTAQTTVSSLLTEVDALKVNSMDRNGNMTKTTAEICEKFIKPFLRSVSTKMQAAFRSALNVSVEPYLISSDPEITGTISDDAGSPSATFSATLGYGGYAGFSFGELTKISSFTAELPENTRLEYSPNGCDWTTFTEDMDNMDVTYVRIVNESTTPLVLENFVISAEGMFKPIEQMTASTNVCNGSYYENYRPANAVDGNTSTKYWSDAPASNGDYFQVDLGTVVPVGTASILFGGNPKGAANGIDGFSSTRLQISEDGAVWETVGEDLPVASYESVTSGSNTQAKASFEVGGKKARYVRFVAAQAHDSNWIQVYEIDVQQSGSTGGNTALNIGSTNTAGNIGSLCDVNLHTAFTVETPAEGDYVIYNLSAITSVKTLQILQSGVSNAKVSVQTYDGNWKEAGTLDAENKSFDINERIKAVRLDLSAGEAAAIQEVVVRPTDELIKNTIMPPVVPELFDTTLLKTALAKADTCTEDDFAKGWDALAKAVDAGEDVLAQHDSQEEIDEAAKALNQALLNLRLHLGELPK